MLVAISGSQGTGKTTILKELRKKGYSVVETKIARSIMEDWNVELSQINESLELTLSFQQEVTKRKSEIEEPYAKCDGLWFTERTHADVFTYALVTLGPHNMYSNWVDKYYETCLKHNQMYSLIFYIRAGQFKVEHDGTRGANTHYSRMVDLTMLDLTSQMIHTSRLSFIETSNPAQRLNIIESQTLSIWKSSKKCKMNKLM